MTVAGRPRGCRPPIRLLPRHRHADGVFGLQRLTREPLVFPCRCSVASPPSHWQMLNISPPRLVRVMSAQVTTFVFPAFGIISCDRCSLLGFAVWALSRFGFARHDQRPRPKGAAGSAAKQGSGPQPGIQAARPARSGIPERGRGGIPPARGSRPSFSTDFTVWSRDPSRARIQR
jgi:hypothetical protein